MEEAPRYPRFFHSPYRSSATDLLSAEFSRVFHHTVHLMGGQLNTFSISQGDQKHTNVFQVPYSRKKKS